MSSDGKSNLISLPLPATADAPDMDLVLAVAAGNKAALRAIWQRYVAPVRTTLRSLLGRDDILDDLVQAVFLTFYRSAGRLRDQAGLRCYLLGLAAKLACSELGTRAGRKRWRRLFHWAVRGRPVRLPDVDERDAGRTLCGVLAKVPRRERQAFVLRYVHDLAPAEVADAMGIPHGTAKRAISEGRRRVMLRALDEPAWVLLRESDPDVADNERMQTEWQRLLLATHREDAVRARPPGLRRVWLMAPLAAGVVFLAAAGLLGRSRPEASLRFQLDGHELVQSYLSAEATQPRRVDFSDGSQLLLRPSGRMRIASNHNQGARLSLERGRLDLSIRHHPTTHWQVDAGPYVVQATGTRFNVNWEPDGGDFSVALAEGSVQIVGPGLPKPITLEVGQQLQAKSSGSYTIKKQPAPSVAEPASPTVPKPQATASSVSSVASVKGKRRASATASSP